MKKIITLFLVWGCLFSFNLKGANLYLIDNGNTNGTNKIWGTPSISGFTNIYKVNLSTCNAGNLASLTEWLTDRNKTSAPTYSVTQIVGTAGNVTFTNSDQIWIACGTYNVTTAWIILSGSGAVVPAGIYGGFAGTETTTLREKGVNAWDYINETKINGSGSTTGILTASGDRNLTIDGITFTSCTTVAALISRGGMNVQNCKFTSNTAGALTYYTTTTSKNTSCSNSYFYNNSISGSSLNAASIYVNNASSGGIYTISGCLFDSNSSSATTSGASAGIKCQGVGISNTTGCVFKNNSASEGNSSSVSLTTVNNNLTNCLIYGTVLAAKPALYLTNGNVTNCTFVNNLGGGAYLNQTASASNLKITNTVFWGSDGSATTGSGVISAISNCVGTITNCAYNGLSANFISTPTGTIALTTTSINLFTNPDNNIWSLAAGSSLLDKGTSTNAPATDFNGLTRSGQGSNYDIGAFEAIQGNVSISDITSLTPNSDVSVLNSGLLTINSNKKINSLSVGIGGQATLSSGNTLECNKMIIASNASGVGTFVDNGGTLNSTTAIAQQQLAAARNWYMSSPVSGATGLPTVNSGSVVFYSYPENDAAQATGGSGFAAGGVWNTVDAGSFVTGKGYIVKPGDVNATVSFTGTSFNTGDKIISALTNTTDNPKHGFNLIGNPYPSYVNVLPSVTANANLEPTVWYRTRDTNETPLYHFETVNATSGVGTNAAGTGRVTGFIPPMQGFWVRTNADGESITLLNANRSHATSVSMTDIGVVPTTGLKAPAAVKSDFSLLGLYVSNGSTGDETILMFAPGASNDQDVYDSQKISNNNASIPEIYTLAGKVQLAINGMRNFSETEIPLGFTTGTAGNFTIKTSELRNFDSNTRIWLLDKQENKQTELTPETEYTFSSTATTGNESRFSLLFRAPGATTGNGNAESNQVSVFVNAQNGIVINAVEGSRYSVYNTAGQQMAAGKTVSAFETINQQLNNGVYVVRVGSVSKRVIVK